MENLISNLLSIAPASYIPRDNASLNTIYVKKIIQEHQRAFYPEQSRLQHQTPQIRNLQLNNIPTTGERILILCNSKENYHGSCNNFGAKKLTIAAARSLLGPIFINTKKNKKTIQAPFDSIFSFTKNIDHLWIPDPYIASLFFRSLDLTSIAAAKVKKSILFSINIEPSTDELGWTDHQIRSQLHTNGFIEVVNIDQKNQGSHISRWHEFQKYYSATPSVNLAPGTHLYIAKKLPEAQKIK